MICREEPGEVWVILELRLQKSLGRFVQEIRILKSSETVATKLFKLCPYKATVVRALLPRVLDSRFNFCNCSFQLVHLHEVDPCFI